MLSDRIIQTLKFFDLQDLPLTALELERYLIADKKPLLAKLDESHELVNLDSVPAPVHLDTILVQLDTLLQDGLVELNKGFYYLPGRSEIIQTRLLNYLNGLRREKLLRRFVWFTKHLPFVRGIALGGSQPLGQQKPTSDIDLLIITDPNYMWTARTFLMVYFQLFGVRRYGNKIANRFCLNHYLAVPREVDAERNLYKAMEYGRLRPLVYGATIRRFQRVNAKWINIFFPNMQFPDTALETSSVAQRLIEAVLNNRLGAWLEKKLGQWQSGRIRQDQFVFVRPDELSFHPESKHETLLQGFFGK
ncbi:MAG TPA: nucleotidyltransferase domain-containing protein [Candidatus Doudnabacteria bacterium]|nr:nucleotidyltransferase domain-containing protein [Candidatus Doudnabacteria bacterium]